MERKEFIKKAGMAAAAIAVMPDNVFAKTPDGKVRAVIIGTGLRGQKPSRSFIKKR